MFKDAKFYHTICEHNFYSPKSLFVMGWKRELKLDFEGFVEFREAEHVGFIEMEERCIKMKCYKWEYMSGKRHGMRKRTCECIAWI